jgi:hypothetical protein
MYFGTSLYMCAHDTQYVPIMRGRHAFSRLLAFTKFRQERPAVRGLLLPWRSGRCPSVLSDSTGADSESARHEGVAFGAIDWREAREAGAHKAASREARAQEADPCHETYHCLLHASEDVAPKGRMPFGGTAGS